MWLNEVIQIGFCANSLDFDRQLFQLVVLLKSDFNYGNNFALY